jgi:putative ABC transport system permease protein
MRGVGADLRYILRGLAARPGFTLAAVLSLALGIGANGAVFSAVHALLLRPFPFAHADRLVRISSVRGHVEGALSVPEQDDLAALSHVIKDIALYTDQGMYNASGFGTPEELPATITTHNLFRVLGVHPVVGSTFPPDFDRTRQFGLIISHGLWMRRFAGAPDIVGRTMTLDGAPGYRIFGVLPASFNFPANADLFRSSGISATPQSYQRRDLRSRMAVARLASGVTIERAQAAVDALATRLAREFPTTNGGLTLKVTPLRDLYVHNVRGHLWLLAVSVALVLLVASVNVTNLTLARALARRRERAVRLALGATAGRLLRQALMEALLLAFLGALTGAAVAWAGVATLNRLIRLQLPPWMQIEVDGTTVVALAGFALVAAVLVGLLPALRSRDFEVHRALREEGRSTAGSRRQERLRGWLVVSEVALAVALVTGAGLLVQSFRRLQVVDLGFRTANLFTFRVELGWRAYDSHEKVVQFNDQVLERLSQLPGVVGVGLDSNLPLSGKPRDPQTLELEGQSEHDRRNNPYVNEHTVNARYVETLGLVLERGRSFTEADRLDSEPVALISAGLARRLWPNGHVIGRRLRIGPASPASQWVAVVGVVGDIRHAGVRAVEYDVYRPYAQSWAGGSWFLARVAGDTDPMTIARAAAAIVPGVDPDQSFFDVQTMMERVTMAVWQERLAGALVAAFGGIAALIAAVGLAGLVSYLVRQRAREIGIRLALGAERRVVAGLFLKQAGRLVGAGLVGGLLIALGGRALVAHLVYEASAFDEVLLVAIPAGLGAGALMVSWLAAWRGTRVDPVTVLRG